MDIYTIRSTFIDFFKKKGHVHIPAVPIVNQDDPDLLFVNAGMNPFKNIFLGDEAPRQKEVVNSQPCLRVTGKHNDLEEVGKDTYHHTLFEMQGNWSFNSYFKKEAIAWAWELLMVYGIDPKRLYVTVFEGEKSENLISDSEVYELWQKYLPEKHILYGGKKDNFWEMGTTGPCGPCTEIHIDVRGNQERQQVPGSELVNNNHQQVIELWNLVFIQYNRNANNELNVLPKKHVDTGMGLERLAMVLQKKQSTYETDVFMPIIQSIAQEAGTVYGKSKITDIALRVIADHIRAITFAIADGVIPSNQRAGYVIRRILRRALRYGHTYLDLKEPFLHTLANEVIQTLGRAYPNLQKQQSLIQKIIYQEEQSFIQTLSQGLSRLTYITKNFSKKQAAIQGEVVFELYDTYGFPPDLTSLIVREQGLSIDEKGFEACMKQQKTRSKKAGELHQSDWHLVHSSLTSSIFTGYDELTTCSHLIKYRLVQKKGITYYQLVLEKTPFYAEAGGQVGDTGYLTAEGQKIKVLDTQSENNLIVHYTTELPKNLQKPLVATVDKKRREAISKNHTTTHLVLETISKTLGKHVTQQGSLVHEQGLRFDFTHHQKISLSTIQKVEELVNEAIRANFLLKEVRNMPIEQAKKMGATATFGEKYGEEVRVVSYGNYCSDLCGGTHVQATGQIGFFKIKTEKSISAGIRRIEAVTGLEAEKWVQSQQATLARIGGQLKNEQDPAKAAEQLIARYNQLKQRFERLSHRVLLEEEQKLQQKVTYIGKMYVCIEKVRVESVEHLKKLAFSLNKANEPSFIVLATILEEKAHLIVIVSAELTMYYHAQNIIKRLVPHIQGKGGGKAHFALASGQRVEGVSKALQIAKDIFEKRAS